ncbi:Fic family protein [Roseomonas aerophila]|uniref:Fic family protein n=1 Tax=Teichococcus aerophilus TaxID=1224513 RepID=A0ABR7RU30_9PROT|nr:Fic family protein [Pseudoroseomonas aerophila]MBC9209542.1 Fic family protein [Pseudoroseomonas aerophila]
MQAAQETTSRADKRLLSRAASFLLLADSQASFLIEGERPPRNRIERWGRAVLRAGQRPLSVDGLERLQSVLIEDSRHVRPGLRREGVFLGDRTQDGLPVPEFIRARSEGLPALLEGLLATNARMGTGEIDPVLQAAAIAFGFVTVHLFEDGNGRLHRFLVHHVLAERRFSPPGLVAEADHMLGRGPTARPAGGGVRLRPLHNAPRYRPPGGRRHHGPRSAWLGRRRARRGPLVSMDLGLPVCHAEPLGERYR